MRCCVEVAPEVVMGALVRMVRCCVEVVLEVVMGAPVRMVLVFSVLCDSCVLGNSTRG